MKSWFRATTITATVIALLGCGTLMYPERQGQTRGKVDPAVLVMDGAMLFLFVVPGLVAFGVDFHTGAIYLPTQTGEVRVIPIEGPSRITRDRIETVLAEEVGVAIDLDSALVEVRPLPAGSVSEDLRALVSDAAPRA